MKELSIARMVRQGKDKASELFSGCQSIISYFPGLLSLSKTEPRVCQKDKGYGRTFPKNVMALGENHVRFKDPERFAV